MTNLVSLFRSKPHLFYTDGKIPHLQKSHPRALLQLLWVYLPPVFFVCLFLLLHLFFSSLSCLIFFHFCEVDRTGEQIPWKFCLPCREKEELWKVNTVWKKKKNFLHLNGRSSTDSITGWISFASEAIPCESTIEPHNYRDVSFFLPPLPQCCSCFSDR